MWAKRIASYLAVTLLVGLILPVQALAQTSIPVEFTVPDTILTVYGKAPGSALVTVQESGTTIGTSTAGLNGDFSLSLASQSTGIRTISAFYVDSDAKSSRILTKQISVQPHQETQLEMLLAPTIERRTDYQNQQGSIVQISGYAYPSSTVKLSVNGPSQVAVSTQSDSQGFYEFLLNTKTLVDGVYTATTTSTKDGKQSTESNKINFEVTSTPVSGPSAPDIVVSPEKLPPPTALSPDDGALIDGDTVIISGDSVPFAQINIYVNNVIIGSVFADESGKWSFEYTATSTPVTLTFEACLDGICSVLSKSITLNFSLPLSCNLAFKLEEYRFWDIKEGEEFALELSEGSSEGAYEINWGDGVEEKFNYDSEMSRVISKTYNVKGHYNGQIEISSSTNCKQTRYFSVNVSENDSRSYDDKLFWVFLIIVGMLIISLLSRRENKESK